MQGQEAMQEKGRQHLRSFMWRAAENRKDWGDHLRQFLAGDGKGEGIACAIPGRAPSTGFGDLGDDATYTKVFKFERRSRLDIPAPMEWDYVLERFQRELFALKKLRRPFKVTIASDDLSALSIVEDHLVEITLDKDSSIFERTFCRPSQPLVVSGDGPRSLEICQSATGVEKQIKILKAKGSFLAVPEYAPAVVMQRLDGQPLDEFKVEKNHKFH